MARNLSNNMKRAVAGVCAVLVIAGAVPVQPIADVVRTSVIEAKADNYDSESRVPFTLLKVNDTLAAGADINTLGASFNVILDNNPVASGTTLYTVPTTVSGGFVTVTSVSGTDVYLKSNSSTSEPETKYAKIVTKNSSGSSSKTVTESVELPKTYTVQELIPSNLIIWGGVAEVTALTVSGDNAQKTDGSISKDSDIQINGTGDFTITLSYKDYNNQTYSGLSYTVSVTEATTVAPTVTAPTKTTATLTYNKNAQQLFATSGSVTEGQGIMYYAVTTTNQEPDGGSWSSSIDSLKKTNAGTYYLWYKVKGNEGYNDVAPTPVEGNPVTIKKADLTAPTITLAEDINVPIISSAIATGGTLYYKVKNAENNTWVNDWTAFTTAENCYKLTTAGNYEVFYYVAASDQTNYKNYGSETEPKSAGFISKMAARELDLKAYNISLPTGFNYGSNGEVESNLTDLNQKTKLCVTKKSGSNTISDGTPITVYFKITSGTIEDFVLNNSYTMTTGNDTSDYTGRNPRSWKIEGYNKYTDQWEEIKTETNNTGLTTNNWSLANFSFSKPNKVFNKLRVSFTKTSGDDTQFQLSEMFFDGKVMRQPTYAFTVNTAAIYDGNPHSVMTSNSGSAGGTIHYLYKKDGAANWTAYTGEGIPTFKDAGTYEIAWYSDIDYTNAYYASGSAASPNVIATKYTIYPKFDMTDDQEESYAEDGHVMDAVTKIEYESADVTANKSATGMEFLPNKTIKVYSKGKLVFTVTKSGNVAGTSSDLTNFTETYDNTGYVYTFKIPTGVNVVTAKRVYDYTLAVDGNKLIGHDKNTKPVQNDYTVATLVANSHEYLVPLTDIEVDVDAAYELANSSTIKYYAPDDEGIEKETTPVNVGTYTARAAVSTSAQEASYELVKSFNITPRNYALHSGTDAPVDNKITATVNFTDAKTVYNGNKQTPQVTITDTKISGSDKTLKRGTDYELYKKNGNTYTKVADVSGDEAAFGQTNAGTYNVYVKFIGNYMNTGDEYVPVEWTIEKATLPELTINGPTSTVFNYQPHPVTAAPTTTGTLPDGVIKYEYSSDGGNTYSSTAPTNAGAYKAKITVQNANYKLANNLTEMTKDFTIDAKNIDDLLTADSVKVTVTNGRPVVSFKFTDPQKSSTSAYQKVTLVEGTDFTTAYSQVAGQGNTYQFAVAPKAGSNYTFTDNTANTKKTFTTETALTTATVTLASNADIVYDGTAKKPDVVVKFGDTVLTKDTDYTVSYSNNINAGTATVTVSDGESAAFVTGSTTFTIQPKSIDAASIKITASSPVANGTTAVTPDITVVDEAIDIGGAKKTLVAGTDYTVSYSNNVNAGCDTGVITLKGKGNYTGTNATGRFSIKSTLDIEAVKSMITKIEYDENGDEDFADEGETIAPTTFENTYNFIPTKKIRITSRGKLSFTDGHTVVAAENQTSSGYVYKIKIDNGTNKVTATHVYDYTNLVGTTDGQSVTITGIDTNIINNTTPTNLASVTIGDVYFLDDISTKITTQAVNAPHTTVSYGTITYTAVDGGAALNNRLPYSAGNYKAALTVTLTDDSGTETFRITDLPFTVKPRVYNNNTSEIGIAVTYGDSTTTTPFVQDYTNNTVFVPTITITDSKISGNDKTLKRGIDYQLCKSDGTEVAAAEDKNEFGQSAANNYSNIYVKFKGNYVNDATDVTALKPVSWTIAAKPTAVVTTLPKGKTLTESGSAQVLIEAGVASHGTLKYALGDNSTTAPTDESKWKTDYTEIKGTTADTYYVWYKVDDDDTCYGTAEAKCVTATINKYVPEKKDQTWTVTVDNYVYDGTAHKPKINGTLYGDLTYRYINTDTNEVLAEAPTAIGNYELEVTAAGTSTYNPRTWSTTYSILEKADYSVTGARFHTANTVSFKEKVEFNFLVETKDVYTAEGAYVVFTYKHYGEDVTVTKQINKADKNGKYYRVRLPLTASEMATEIKAELYLANSDKPVDTKIRSIKDYAEAAIEAGLDGSDVLKAMLNYGGYTQTALGNNIDLLANSGEGIAVDVSGVAPKSATTFVRPTAAEGAKVTYKGSTTMTTSDLYVRHYFTVDPSLTASELNAVKVKVGENDPVSMSKLKKNSMGYYYEASPELAYELDRENGSIVVYGFEGAETADSPNAIRIENYNVIDYCEAVANSSTHTVEAKNMVKALYSYYTAAKAYVESRV